MGVNSNYFENCKKADEFIEGFKKYYKEYLYERCTEEFNEIQINRNSVSIERKQNSLPQNKRNLIIRLTRIIKKALVKGLSNVKPYNNI